MAPAAAAASRIWSISPHSSAGSYRVSGSISATRDGEICPAAIAYARWACRPRVRMMRVGRVEPAQEPGLGGGELRLQFPEGSEHPAEDGRVQQCRVRPVR